MIKKEVCTEGLIRTADYLKFESRKTTNLTEKTFSLSGFGYCFSPRPPGDCISESVTLTSPNLENCIPKNLF